MFAVLCQNVEALLPNGLDAAMREIPEWRARKALSFRFDADRRLSVAAWLLLKRLLAEHGFDADALPLRTTALGKPEFADPAAPFFSLSHSGQVVMAAISSLPVGCDVERLRKLHPGLPEECLAADELAALPPDDGTDARERAFYRFWVRKESYLKATGCGLSAKLRATSTLSSEITSRWLIDDFAAPDGYLAAVCRQRAESEA